MMMINLGNGSTYSALSNTLIDTPKGVVSFESIDTNFLNYTGERKRIYLNTADITMICTEKGEAILEDLEDFIKHNLGKSNQ